VSEKHIQCEDETLIIAIDGPAASGKSTTARLVADKLGYMYIDTGAMYRAVTLKTIRRFGAQYTEEDVAALLPETHIELRREDNHSAHTSIKVFLDDEEVTSDIRSQEVSAEVSRVSAIPRVRERLVALQREMSKNERVVLDGRDIGTVVFPHADVKVYLVASIEERARRRQKELQDQSAATLNASIDDLAARLATRDRFDSTRDHSPLSCAPDALRLDTTNMTIECQVEAVLELASQGIKKI